MTPMHSGNHARRTPSRRCVTEPTQKAHCNAIPKTPKFSRSGRKLKSIFGSLSFNVDDSDDDVFASNKAKPTPRSRRRLNLDENPACPQINTGPECDTSDDDDANFEAGACHSSSSEENDSDIDETRKTSAKRRQQSGKRVSAKTPTSSRKSVSLLTPSLPKRERAVSAHRTPLDIAKSL